MPGTEDVMLTDDQFDARMRIMLSIALLSIIVGGAADLVMDGVDSWLSAHALFESLLIVGALVMATTLWLGWWRKEIAARTGRSERTVRQHASVVYEKAALGGRAESAAFFLQDLILPEPEREVLPVRSASAG